MPSNDINTERDLAKFSHLTVLAKFRNKKFTAKVIRNDIVLFQSFQSVVDSTTKKTNKVLNDRQKNWNVDQKTLQKERIQQKINEHSKEGEYITKPLQACKSWGGPWTTANELEIVHLNKNKDISNKIVRTELSYYRKTHQAVRHETPELFKPTKISHEEWLENLFVLLSNRTNKIASTASTAMLDLPTNEELSHVIFDHNPEVKNHVSVVDINQLCIVVWEVEKEVKWFLGYVKKISEDGYTAEYLHWSPSTQNDSWNYPSPDAIQTVSEEQIIPCKRLGTN